MTTTQKKLVAKLLSGHFLRYFKRGGKDWYILYDAKVNPLQKIYCRTVDKIDRFMDPDIKLWKRNKDGDMSLNLSMVRRLHGRNTIKRLYKKKLEVNSDDRIYKKRISKIKRKTDNEKANTLFGDA